MEIGVAVIKMMIRVKDLVAIMVLVEMEEAMTTLIITNIDNRDNNKDRDENRIDEGKVKMIN